MRSLTISISSLEICLFSSFAHFLIGLIVFPELSCMIYLHIWEINSWAVVWFAVFCSILKAVFFFFFHLALNFLAVQKIRCLSRSLLFLFVSFSTTLGGECRFGPGCDFCQSVFCLFSSKSFIVSGLSLRSLIHLVLIFLQGVRKE